MDVLPNSRILSYHNNYTSLSRMDGTVVLDQPINFIDYRHTEKPRRMQVRLTQVAFTSRIPNVYSLPDGSFNNGKLRVSNNGGSTWTTIQLTNGVYTIPYIQAAINSVINNWWTDINDPGLTVKYNLATELVYITLDSTKLASPGQVAIDLSQSQISDLLGYSTTKTFTTDGVKVADKPAMLNWCGDSISVLLHGFGTLSILNGKLSEEFCSVPLTVSQVGNEYVYPSASISPDSIDVDPMATLTQFSVEFVGSRLDPTGRPYPVYVTDGSVKLIFKLSWG